MKYWLMDNATRADKDLALSLGVKIINASCGNNLHEDSIFTPKKEELGSTNTKSKKAASKARK